MSRREAQKALQATEKAIERAANVLELVRLEEERETIEQILAGK